MKYANYVFLLLCFLCLGQTRAEVRSGLSYASPDIQALQLDLFRNPGSLWLEEGKKLFSDCTACHQDMQKMRGVILRYPKLSTTSNQHTRQLQTLEARIWQCQSEHLQQKPWATESKELLAVTTYIAHASLGLPIERELSASEKPFWLAGKGLYFTRLGQLNLACTHCHDQLAGKRLLGQTISQGQSNGYPTYRLEWNGIGSLARRIRACFQGVRAEPPPADSAEMANLILYMQTRSSGLRVETPAVRR
ncbi:MAG: L-cysteine S-thiosulfotransferase subunit SoxA [Pseudomonadota bacterium]